MAEGVTERLVLDRSVTLAWYFADEANAYADAVAQGLANGEALVPSLWPLEVANALLMGERRKRSTEAQAAAFLARLETLPIVIDDQTRAKAWGVTLRLARAQDLSA
jgi:predicted nucleic acid-binding protein